MRKENLRQASHLLLESLGTPKRSTTATTQSTKKDQFSSSYRTAIETTLRSFVENGNDIACTGVYIYEYGRCELCGHLPIKWHYILENLWSHKRIVVGSECIRNHKTILEEWGYKPAYVVFPECLAQYTRWILDEDFDAIQSSDKVASFYTKNPLDMYGIMHDDQKLQMFIYVKKLDGQLVASDARKESILF